MIKSKLESSVNLPVIYVAAAVIFSVIGCRAQSKVTTPTNNSVSIKTASKINFTSVYTKLNSETCKPVWKPETETDEPPEICSGYKGYKIYVKTHGISSFQVGWEISANNDSWNNLELPSFLLNPSEEQIIEWRLADGEPFACIVRAEYDKEYFAPDEKGKVNQLAVRNLRGFAPIIVSIDATKNKRANEEARRAADAGYGKL